MRSRRISPFFFLVLLSFAACPAKEEAAKALPPSGLAGAPVAAPTGGSHANQLPQGHPPIGTGSAPAKVPPLSSTPGHGGLGVPNVKPDVKLTGTVLETHQAASYTYLKFKTESNEEKWAAVLEIPLKKGQKVEISQQMVMNDFQSKSLNRTFDAIIFGTAKPLP